MSGSEDDEMELDSHRAGNPSGEDLNGTLASARQRERDRVRFQLDSTSEDVEKDDIGKQDTSDDSDLERTQPDQSELLSKSDEERLEREGDRSSSDSSPSSSDSAQDGDPSAGSRPSTPKPMRRGRGAGGDGGSLDPRRNIRINFTLAILYLACTTLRIPLMVTDLCR